MKEIKGGPAAPRKVSIDGADGAVSKNGASIHSATVPVLKHPKTELEAAIQRYVDLFDYAPIAYVSFDRVGHIEEINLAAAQLLGARRDRLIGDPFAFYVTREDAGLFLSHLLHCRSSDSRVETELHLKKRSGEIIPVRLASSPATSSMRDGALLYQTAIIDLTERKRAENSICQSELRYRTLFDLVPVALYACDADGLIQEFNQRAVELWGRKPRKNDPKEKFCGSFKIFFPDGRSMPHEKCPMARALRGETLEAADREIVVERTNGARRNVIVSPTVLRDGHGKVTGAINCLHDITERHRTDEALRESEERYRAIINQSVVGMARSDLKGRLIFINQKLCEMLGYKEAELVGKTIRAITHPDDRAQNTRLFQRMIARREPFEWEKRYLRKDGSILWASVSVSLLHDAAGKAQSAVAVIIDISDRREAQAELEDARNFLESRVREQTGELHAANEELKKEIKRRLGLEGQILEVSDREQQRLGQELHDGICQHLTAVAFMAQAVALRLRDHRVFQVEDIEKIAELVNTAAADVRNLARGLHRIDVDAAGLVTALRNLVDREIWKTPCRLKIKGPFHIEDDEAAIHLYRIAREAVINAAKHAQAREIVVKLSQSPKGICLSVTDDGIGMPKNHDRTKGMGFHIMNDRARSVGGRLEVESPKQGGTRITCHLPKPK
jgi:PAS domain S-box-containing protein